MIGWLIVFVVFVLATLVFVVLKIYAGIYNDYEIGILIFGLCTLCLLIPLIMAPLEVKKEVNTFKRYQELVEVSYSETETELNFAMNIQVIELNTWLAEARATEETYGIFSFYRNKLDDLEYIQIGD